MPAGLFSDRGPLARSPSVEGKAISKDLRCNERIRISQVRLIDQDGNQVGIVDTRQALLRAREAGLDLVEVSPNSRPPVCRIMDYGKWKYAQKKKERRAKAHRHDTELKEVRIRTPKIGSHDLAIKVDRAREFLARGDRVQFTLRFRGRELAHLELGRDLLNSVKQTLADLAKVERDFRMEGRALTMVLAPLAKPKVAEPAQASEGASAGRLAPARSSQAQNPPPAP